jgi:hypothetical protein
MCGYWEMAKKEIFGADVKRQVLVECFCELFPVDDKVWLIYDSEKNWMEILQWKKWKG